MNSRKVIVLVILALYIWIMFKNLFEEPRMLSLKVKYVCAKHNI